MRLPVFVFEIEIVLEFELVIEIEFEFEFAIEIALELVTPIVHFTDIMSQELPVYSKSQLSLRNGNDHEKIWVCYKGYIYDVTSSRLWKDGNHYEHWAGQDLTHELPDAPHTENVFDKFQPIGKLSKI